MKRLRLGFLASHGGSNLQAIVDACHDGRLSADPCVAICNNSREPACERARLAGIPVYHLSEKTSPAPEDLDRAIVGVLDDYRVDLVVLAGYLKRLGPRTVTTYRGRILNVHPSLLPKYGGQGMYGRFVHEAVLAAGETVTGATIHLVDEEYDHGSILAQCEVPVHPDDSPDSLGSRVRECEHPLYVKTLRKVSEGELLLQQQIR